MNEDRKKGLNLRRLFTGLDPPKLKLFGWSEKRTTYSTPHVKPISK
jgi:hypothetical protein